MTYLGMCESPYGTIVVLSNYVLEAERKLFKEWSQRVVKGFAQENHIHNFADLRDWNGASVKRLEIDTPVIWEML